MPSPSYYPGDCCTWMGGWVCLLLKPFLVPFLFFMQLLYVPTICYLCPSWASLHLFIWVSILFSSSSSLPATLPALPCYSYCCNNGFAAFHRWLLPSAPAASLPAAVFCLYGLLGSSPCTPLGSARWYFPFCVARCFIAYMPAAAPSFCSSWFCFCCTVRCLPSALCHTLAHLVFARSYACCAFAFFALTYAPLSHSLHSITLLRDACCMPRHVPVFTAVAFFI